MFTALFIVVAHVHLYNKNQFIRNVNLPKLNYMRTKTYNIILIIISDPLGARLGSALNYKQVDNTSRIRRTNYICHICLESANLVTFESITLKISQDGVTVHTQEFPGLFYK